MCVKASFIHSDYFYSASSSPLRGAPDTARIGLLTMPVSCRKGTRNDCAWASYAIRVSSEFVHFT